MDELTDEAQVRFQAPDQDWRTYVSNLTVSGQPVNALNVYLIDLRENRKLRSNEKVRESVNGMISETLAPARLDCHYLITAWSPAAVSAAVEPAVDEHALLYKAGGVLLRAGALVPSEVYAPNPVPAAFPANLVDAELPMAVLPVEGFPKLSEFWTAMDWRWKPGIYLVVTIPVYLETSVAGPMVTTRITDFRPGGRTGVVERAIEIGGHVRVAATGVPVANAWVRLEDALSNPVQVTHTDSMGSFVFSRLQEASYTLRVRALGFPEATVNIQVPSPTGNYNVQLS